MRISGRFDFIVSNPPYVRRDEITRLQREVREHEPHVALFSPEDELAIYRRLVFGGENLLNPGGHILMEVGLGMDERVLAFCGPTLGKASDENGSSRHSSDGYCEIAVI